jgi:hypothetical protein
MGITDLAHCLTNKQQIVRFVVDGENVGRGNFHVYYKLSTWVIGIASTPANADFPLHVGAGNIGLAPLEGAPVLDLQRACPEKP